MSQALFETLNSPCTWFGPQIPVLSDFFFFQFTVNTSPTPEDLMLSQYVYRPKIQIYKEDCEALCRKIEEYESFHLLCVLLDG